MCMFGCKITWKGCEPWFRDCDLSEAFDFEESRKFVYGADIEMENELRILEAFNKVDVEKVSEEELRQRELESDAHQQWCDGDQHYGREFRPFPSDDCGVCYGELFEEDVISSDELRVLDEIEVQKSQIDSEREVDTRDLRCDSNGCVVSETKSVEANASSQKCESNEQNGGSPVQPKPKINMRDYDPYDSDEGTQFYPWKSVVSPTASWHSDDYEDDSVVSPRDIRGLRCPSCLHRVTDCTCSEDDLPEFFKPKKRQTQLPKVTVPKVIPSWGRRDVKKFFLPKKKSSGSNSQLDKCRCGKQLQTCDCCERCDLLFT